MTYSEPVLAPFLSIASNHSTVYFKRIDREFSNRGKSLKSLENLNNNDQQGIISDNVAKKIKNKIGWLLALSKQKKAKTVAKQTKFTFNLNFITLTLPCPQSHTDNEIKANLLNHFLIVAKRKWNVKNYMWKAETQANKNIHFHILSEVFIPYNELRDCWNSICFKFGYVAHIKDWQKANSTDIHSLKKVKNVANYFIKYFTKNNDTRRLVDGRLWGCNVELSKMNREQIMLSTEQLNQITSASYKDAKNYLTCEHCLLIKLNVKQLISTFTFAFDKVKHYVQSVYRGLVIEKIPILAEKTEKICKNKLLKQSSSYQLQLQGL